MPFVLQDCIQNIRANYTRDFSNKDPTKRQIAVATYLIDKLALRAGNEKVLIQLQISMVSSYIYSALWFIYILLVSKSSQFPNYINYQVNLQVVVLETRVLNINLLPLNI